MGEGSYFWATLYLLLAPTAEQAEFKLKSCSAFVSCSVEWLIKKHFSALVLNTAKYLLTLIIENNSRK